MNILELYVNVLEELDQTASPQMLLNGFNYYLNKSIADIYRELYKVYEINQMISDELAPFLVPMSGNIDYNGNDEFYQIEIASDYYRILRCVVNFEKYGLGCNSSVLQKKIQKGAARLTEQNYAGIVDDAFLKPSNKRPYYKVVRGVDINDDPTWYINIYVGTGESRIVPNSVDLSYFKLPNEYKLTQDMIDGIDTNIPELEFNNDIIYKIIEKITSLMLENNNDQRLQTFSAINQEPQSILPQTN